MIIFFIREYEITNRKLLEVLKVTQNMEYLSQEQLQRVSIFDKIVQSLQLEEYVSHLVSFIG